ncbi:biotin synthetase [Bdellovibrio sp. 22V]|uniref:biotin--[acetyl-CoA-carboxylase] ligase n=1 Tax=Bdellovibrio sp. 22V TaxID=3044166 RepID=UPI00254348C5|nr:biotin synthetase [Bdellovibrio sp. 22V]WII72274.1 biotin synthetase [Bdellovibrio sp. 22V]
MTDTPLADIRIGQITSQWAENNHLFVSYKSQQDSTNALAKSEAFEENLLQESLCLYLTDHQTAGRGRGKNTWLDAQPGSSLLSSWSFLLSVKPQPTTACLVGLAVYRACTATWPFLPWNLKAPNDIYIGDKKVAGILLETLVQGDDVRLIVGFGFNVTASPELETATSLIESLPTGVPLLGQDYLAFLDRFLFELTDAVSHCEEQLSPTDQLSLLMALNFHPLLKEKYTGLEADGSLHIGDKKISWMDL